MIPLILVFVIASFQEDLAREARELLSEGRALEALERLDEARSAHPDDASLHHALGLVYTALGQPAQALEAFSKASDLAPAVEEYALDHGELLYRTGRAEEALPYLEKASARPEALLLLAGAHETLGNEVKALELLQRYVAAKPDEVGARLLLGEKLEQGKRMDDALRVYREGLEALPANGALLARLAELLSRSRETYGEAEELARRATESSPELLEPRLTLARVLSRSGRDEEAIEELERARDAHPEASQVHYNLSQAYQRVGRVEDAREAASRFQTLSEVEKDASEREARVAVTYKKAAELLQSGRMLEAEAVFRSVLEIDPENTQTRSMLAKIAFSRRDPTAAITWIDEAIEKDASVAEYHYLRGLFHARSGRIAEAEPPLRRALELDPAFPDAWSLLGSLLLDGGKPREAATCFERAAALEPSNAAIHLNLASAYAALGEEEEERKAMERYRELVRSR